MLTYFLGDYNTFRIRTKQIPSGSNGIVIYTQNMSTLDDFAFGAAGYTYNECESLLDITFNLEIPLNPIPGDEYRMWVRPSITSSTIPYTQYPPIWNGSLQVFPSQSVDKPAYVNQIPIASAGQDQIPCEVSRQSENEYILYEGGCPSPFGPTTTTTTTAGPTTTTTTSTTTTTTSTSTTSTTSTTTTAPGTPNAFLIFGNQVGGMGGDVCLSGSTDGTIINVTIYGYSLSMSSDINCTIPYGTTWNYQNIPDTYAFNGSLLKGTTSGGSIQVGNYYRSKASGSVAFFISGSGQTPAFGFNISSSGYQDITYSGSILRVQAAGCQLNNQVDCSPATTTTTTTTTQAPGACDCTLFINHGRFNTNATAAYVNCGGNAITTSIAPSGSLLVCAATGSATISGNGAGIQYGSTRPANPTCNTSLTGSCLPSASGQCVTFRNIQPLPNFKYIFWWHDYPTNEIKTTVLVSGESQSVCMVSGSWVGKEASDLSTLIEYGGSCTVANNCIPTTTTTTTAAPIVTFTFGNQIGGQGFDVCYTIQNNTPNGVGIQTSYDLFMSSDSGCTTPYGTTWGYAFGNGRFTNGNTTSSGSIACSSGGSLDTGGPYYRTRISGSFNFDCPSLFAGFSPTQTFDLSNGAYQDLTYNGVTVRIQGPNCTLNNYSGC